MPTILPNHSEPSSFPEMANVTLMTYLQRALPALPVMPPPHPGQNTSNASYHSDDINNITVWQSFNLNTFVIGISFP